MGWFSSKKEIVELRKQIGQLTQHVAQLNQPRGFDAGEFLAALMKGQVEQVGSMTDFMRMIAEVASERSASVLGRRGGRKRAATAQRDAKGRMLPTRRVGAGVSGCVLCDDAGASSFTTQEFEEHQQHKNRPRRVEPERIEPTDAEREVIEREPIRELPDYPLPVVVHPTAERNEVNRSSSHIEAGNAANPGARNGVA